MLLMDCVVTHHGDMKTHEPQVKDARDGFIFFGLLGSGTGGVQQAKKSSHLIREKVMIIMKNSVKLHKIGNSNRESNSNRLIIINLKIACSL